MKHAINLVRDISRAEASLLFAKYRLLVALMFSGEIEKRKDLNRLELCFRQGTSLNTINSLVADLQKEVWLKESWIQTAGGGAIK